MEKEMGLNPAIKYKIVVWWKMGGTGDHRVK
jgi:hypothetical protein